MDRQGLNAKEKFAVNANTNDATHTHTHTENTENSEVQKFRI